LTFELDLDNVMLDRRAKCLCQGSCTWNVIVVTHLRTHRHTRKLSCILSHALTPPIALPVPLQWLVIIVCSKKLI